MEFYVDECGIFRSEYQGEIPVLYLVTKMRIGNGTSRLARCGYFYAVIVYQVIYSY